MHSLQLPTRWTVTSFTVAVRTVCFESGAGQSWQSYGALYANNLVQIATYGNPVETFDSIALSELKTFDVPSTRLLSAAYVLQSHSLLLATEDQCIRSLNLETAAQATVAYCHFGNNIRLVVAGDGSSIAYTQADGSLRILENGSFASPVSCDAFDNEVANVASISSKRVFALSSRGEVSHWNAIDNHLEIDADPTSQQGFSLAISPDGKVIASNGLNQKLRVWSTSNGPETATEYDLALGARSIAFHPDGNHIAGPMPKDLAATADSQLNLIENQKANLALWNVETGKVEGCFGGLKNDGSMLAAATVSDGAVVWKPQTSEVLRFGSESLPQVDQVAFSQDGKFLFAAYRSGQVVVWNIETQKLERKMVCHGDQISGLLVTQDGDRIVTAASSDPTLPVWDWRNGQKVAEIDSGLSSVSDLKFVDGETGLLVGGKKGRIQLLRVAARREVPWASE